jgi:hypothetical protein
MAELPTPEQNGRDILRIFAHFNSRPGEVLRANNFVAVGARWQLRMTDLQNGLEYARENGWIQELPSGGIKLTERGFAEMVPSH